MKYRYVDLFCGIGGFRIAANEVAKKRGIELQCVLSSDIDAEAQKAYEANFGEKPLGDIREIEINMVPDHELLFAGFPCQPFSIIGKGLGFADDRGTLFHEIRRLLEAKRPKAFILENVKQLVGHDNGRTLRHILHVLQDQLGYSVHYKVLNALNYGLPQKRERVLIVGFTDSRPFFSFGGENRSMKPLSAVLEEEVDRKYFASDYIRHSRAGVHTKDAQPTIWHENKSGNISKLPYSCALRANASYNYLLVNGERRLTEREMLRLQGFPDDYRIVCNYSQTRKQAGNSVPVPMIAAVLDHVITSLQVSIRHYQSERSHFVKQIQLQPYANA